MLVLLLLSEVVVRFELLAGFREKFVCAAAF